MFPTSPRLKRLVVAVALATTGLTLATRGPAPAQAALFSDAPAPQAQAQLPNFAAIVRSNSDSVVNITTTGSGDEADDALPLDFPEDSPFGDLFKRFGIPKEALPKGVPHDKVRGIGSGFVLSPDGYIMTNHHVIAKAKEVRVKLTDKREFVAKVVGTDELADIALLKIEASGLTPVRIGDPSRLEVGDWVLAIGAPFGLERTATQGIVSAKGRALPNENYVPFIQTDVPINPGNSGGPLFNLNGEVVGVNSQIYSRSGGYMGLSFAIPINVAMHVADQLKTAGKVTRGWLGLSLQEVTHDLARSFGLEQPRGALVADVDANGPAKAAGLQPGDVILAANGKPISTSADLPPMVGASRPGTPIELTVLRDGRERTVSVTTGTLPDGKTSELADAGEPTGRGRLGIAVGELTREQRERLGVPSGGVLVARVGDGPAREAGVRPGDVLLKLNGNEIRSAADLREQVDKLPPDKPVALQIKRDGAPLWLALTVGKKPVG